MVTINEVLNRKKKIYKFSLNIQKYVLNLLNVIIYYD